MEPPRAPVAAASRRARGGSRPLDPVSPRIAAIGLAAVLLVALALRVTGVRFGLPAVYNPDEVAIMSRALGFAKGDLNPHNFLYPTLYFYLLFGWVGAYFVAARLLGFVPSLAAFQARFFTDPSGIYLAGRLLGVACGVATVGLVYVLARRLFGRTAGLLAALFLAVAPVHVIDSHYVKHDVPVTLAIVAAQIAVVAAAWPRAGAPRPRDAAMAGAACGIAFSMHYYAVFLAVPLALAVVVAHRIPARRALAHLALAAAVMAAVFFLCSPFILVDPRVAWHDIGANRQIVVDRAVTAGGGLFASAGRYLTLLWRDAVGWPVLVLAVAGALQLAVRESRRALVLLSFPLVFLAFISNTVAASRYLNPVLPFVALFAAWGVVWLSRAVPARAAVPLVVGLAAAVPGAVHAVGADLFFRQADTRTLALRFVETRIPNGSGVAVQPYSVPLAPTRESLEEALAAHLGGLDRVPTKFALQLAARPYPDPAYRLVYVGDGGLDPDKIYVSYGDLGGARGLAALRARGVHYVVVKRYNSPQPSTLPFLEALSHEGHRLAVFSPYRSGAARAATAAVEPYLHNTDARIQAPLERPGPLVEVWQIDDLGR